MKYSEKDGSASVFRSPSNFANGNTRKTKPIDAADRGALDGFRVDRDGNLWCGWGSNRALEAEPADLGGRKVYQLKGKSEESHGTT